MTALMIAGALFASGNGVALGQSSTQDVDFSPNPEQCNQAPRTLESIQAAQASGNSGTDMSASEVFELPAGEEPANEVRGGIVSTIVQIIACENAGDPLASLGGVTEAFLTSLGGTGVFGSDVVTLTGASPVALPETRQIELLDTREFRAYEDGRVGVLVYYRSPDPDSGVEAPTLIALWTFSEEDGRWLLDGVVTGLESQFGDMATPPAG